MHELCPPRVTRPCKHLLMANRKAFLCTLVLMDLQCMCLYIHMSNQHRQLLTRSKELMSTPEIDAGVHCNGSFSESF